MDVYRGGGGRSDISHISGEQRDYRRHTHTRLHNRLPNHHASLHEFHACGLCNVMLLCDGREESEIKVRQTKAIKGVRMYVT